MSGSARVFADVPELGALALQQYGIARRDQLGLLGITPQDVAHQCKVLRWRAIGPHLVLLHTGEVTRPARLLGSVLHAGPEAALAAWSATELQGLQRWERDEIHVLVRRDTKVAALPGLVVHYSRRFDPAVHVTVRAGIRTTSPARATVDAASWSPTAAVALALIIAVLAQRVTTRELIGAEFDAAGHIKHGAAIRQYLADLDLGVESLSELRVAPLLAAAGLPKPRRAVPRIIDGRLRRLDLEVDLPDGSVLVIEVDGPDHDDVRARALDTIRDLDNLIGGRPTIRVTPWALRYRRAELVAKLTAVRKAAEARALRPTSRPVGAS